LYNVTSAFRKFKVGDLSDIELFADALEEQIRKVYKEPRLKFGLISAVPLNGAKKRAGEEDRVAKLSEALAERLGVPFAPLFMLRGEISRRLYKNLGYDPAKFEKDYLQRLTIRRSALNSLVENEKSLLLVDDVYTDGLTTQTIRDAIHTLDGCSSLPVTISTLGLMTKKNNMTSRMIGRFTK
jgi:predicted amidophosphoribosyltransferase